MIYDNIAILAGVFTVLVLTGFLHRKLPTSTREERWVHDAAIFVCATFPMWLLIAYWKYEDNVYSYAVNMLGESFTPAIIIVGCYVYVIFVTSIFAFLAAWTAHKLTENSASRDET